LSPERSNWRCGCGSDECAAIKLRHLVDYPLPLTISDYF
jgi:hypothetical protein